MRANRIREIWSSGGHAVNGWLGIPHGVATEAMVQGGWDSLTVDLQHGLVHYDAAVGMLQAISTSPITRSRACPGTSPASS